ncbi:MAG: Cna B-type domain-containing protein, partial [Clostridia bacterium]|nr:Cna B-type domain-containing protein [Clostridia bacterium]
ILLADGDDIDTTTATVDTNWAWAFGNLPKYKFTVNEDDSITKTEIVYTVDETAVPEYETTIEKLEDGTYKITNTHVPEKVNASGKKGWDDANNQDGNRPATLVVKLQADGVDVPGKTVTLTETDGWAEKGFEGLPKYKFEKNADGSITKTEIVYTVDETAVPEYETTIEKLDDGTYKITNTHVPEKVNASVKKVWDDANNQDGIRPATLVVKLLADGVEVPDKTVTLTEADNWAEQGFENLPKYKFTVNEDGSITKTEIVYTWEEEALPTGYELTDTSVDGTITTLTNKHVPEVVEVTVKKIWDDANNQDGKRPAKLVVTLSNGMTVTLSEENGWTASISDLPKFENGVEIVYTWTEDTLPAGYTLTSNKAEGYVTTLTNSYTPELTEATIRKIWNDANNARKLRPESLTVALSNGMTVVLNEANKWTATITDLPKYENGVEIVYTWSEVKMPAGYKLTSTVVEGTVTAITNSIPIDPPPTSDSNVLAVGSCIVLAMAAFLVITARRRKED